MIGRLVDAPDLSPDRRGPRLTNLIIVLQLGAGLEHAYERWIHPKHVTRVISAEGMAEWLAYFAGPDLPMGQDARYLAEYGSLSADHEGKRDHATHCREVLDRRDRQIANAR
jgi:hypothetical protein